MKATPSGGPHDTPALAWRNGAWFGAQVGGTLWMLVGAGILVFRDVVLGAVVAGLFVGVNAAGLLLWRRRARLEAGHALQLLVMVLALFAAATLLVIDARGRLGELWWTGVPALDEAVRAEPRWTYLVLLVYPGFALLFHVRSRRLGGGDGAC